MIQVENIRLNNKDSFKQKNEYCTMKNSTQFCEIIKLSKTNKTYIKQPKLIELYSKLFLNEPVPKQLHNSLVDILSQISCLKLWIYSPTLLFIRFCIFIILHKVNYNKKSIFIFNINYI